MASERAIYIDLEPEEATRLSRLLAGNTVKSGGTQMDDDLFNIYCKLQDSMKVNRMQQSATVPAYGREEKLYKELNKHETDHPATASVEEYATEGRAYYKKAALAQISIGVGSILQAVGTWAIAIILAAAFLSGCAMAPTKGVGGETRPAPELSERARIDAPELIRSADEAGCDLGAVLYSEGKRESKVGIYCAGKMPVPQPGF